MFASQIVTTYSGMKFQDFVKERIFDPLNMTSTTYSVAVANASGLLSQSWAFNGRRIPLSIGNPSSEDLVAGAGGILSNALDMVRISIQCPTSTPCQDLIMLPCRQNGPPQSLTAASTPCPIRLSYQLRSMNSPPRRVRLSLGTSRIPVHRSSAMAWAGSACRFSATM